MGLLYEMVLKKKQSALLAVAYKRIKSSESQISLAQGVPSHAAVPGITGKSSVNLHGMELIQS
ncbi:hypothetical protein [Paenibacillus sp. NPDC058174]|uniref:hypothetical protein n=1 Tax=Paenibacillus sp. NPDC058174 TaxID=3346366 RepID=UPI0036D7BA93